MAASVVNPVNSAWGPLLTPVFNFTGDALQTHNALTGMGRDLFSWTLRVANELNIILPSGSGPIPVAAGGTGSASFAPPNALILAGATSTSPLHASTITTDNGVRITVNANGAVVPNTQTGDILQLCQSDILSCAVAGYGFGHAMSITGQRSNNTNASPTALAPGDVMLILSGRGYQGSNGYSNNRVDVQLQANENWTNTATGTAIVFQTTPNGTITPNAIATFANAACTFTPLVIVNQNTSAAQTPASGTILQLQQADTVVNILEMEATQGHNTLTGYRTEGTVASPTQTAAGVAVTKIAAQVLDSSPARTGDIANVALETINAPTSTDHSSRVRIQVTPTGSTTIGTVATFRSGADGGQGLVGTTANDLATTGNIGEYLSTVVLVANEVNINAAANVCTLSLTAGDWNVWGELWVDNSTGASTISGRASAAITTTSATTPTVPADGTARTVYDSTPLTTSVFALVIPVSTVRISLGTTTNVYLVGQVTTSAGTTNGYGKIAARRVR